MEAYATSFDSIINQHLAEHCGRSPKTSIEVGIVVTSWCNFFGSVSYPSVIDACLRVNSIGKTSVQYEVGIFEAGVEEVKAVGGFTHVFCDKETFRPQKEGMCDEVRKGLELIMVDDSDAKTEEKAKL